MKINIGTLNKSKLRAVEQIISEYSILEGAIVQGVKVDSGVSSQPDSIDATILGAKNRARLAFAQGGNLGIGIESGVIPSKHLHSGWLNIVFVAVYDGNHYAIGSGPGYEYPREATLKQRESGEEWSDVWRNLGYTSLEKIGEHMGIIHQLSNGRIDRTNYIKPGLRMALCQLEHSEWYKK